MKSYANLSDAERSALMARIRKTNTKPEILVRRLSHALGFRFRLHRKDLPGTPDLVFPRLKKVILVHGCFWHRHDCKAGLKRPGKNLSYWLPKLERNVRRDSNVRAALELSGWQVLVVWECQTRRQEGLREKLKDFLTAGPDG